MKKAIALTATCALVTFALLASHTSADDAIRQQILTLFPEADTNKDGAISDAEEAAVSRQALKRYPRADRDGDGVLSDTEKRALLRLAANRAKRKPANSPTDRAKNKPGFSNVQYGEHERQVFDIWLADTDEPAPLAIYIHGGGFKAGSKENLRSDDLSHLLKAGISVAAINYRYLTIAPLPAAHHDARRALQFMRSKSKEWNIDNDRIAAFGGSAGAQICMWLAYSDDQQFESNRAGVNSPDLRCDCGWADIQRRRVLEKDDWPTARREGHPVALPAVERRTGS